MFYFLIIITLVSFSPERSFGGYLFSKEDSLAHHTIGMKMVNGSLVVDTVGLCKLFPGLYHGIKDIIIIATNDTADISTILKAKVARSVSSEMIVFLNTSLSALPAVLKKIKIESVMIVNHNVETLPLFLQALSVNAEIAGVGFHYIRLKGVPRELELFPKLISLDLEDVGIIDLKQWKIPSQLSSFSCSADSITSFPETALHGNIKLDGMGVTLKKQKTLPKNIENLKSLVQVGLHLERDSFDLQSLCPISQLSNLKVLSLSGQGVATIPECLNKSHSIERLELRECPIQNLPDSLINFESLRTVIIERTTLKKIPSVLFRMKNLSYISLYKNKIYEVPDEMPVSYKNGIRFDLSEPLLSDESLEKLRKMLKLSIFNEK